MFYCTVCSKQLWNKISLYKYVVLKNVGRCNFISLFHTHLNTRESTEVLLFTSKDGGL